MLSPPTDSPARSRSNSCSDDASSAASVSEKSTESTGNLKCAPRKKKVRGRRHRKSSSPQQNSFVPLEEQDKYVALDCEMVGVATTSTNGTPKSAVARVTIVHWNGMKLYDQFVKPQQEVVDYRTFVSGIRPGDLNAGISLERCRTEVLEILRGKILVGHALKNDLHALDIQHPWYMIRDTAKYEPFQKVRFDDGILWPRKLKELTKELIGRDIQVVGRPHSAYEDAVAALDLYKKVRSKWEKVMDYKLAKTRAIEEQRRAVNE